MSIFQKIPSYISSISLWAILIFVVNTTLYSKDNVPVSHIRKSSIELTETVMKIGIVRSIDISDSNSVNPAKITTLPVEKIPKKIKNILSSVETERASTCWEGIQKQETNGGSEDEKFYKLLPIKVRKTNPAVAQATSIISNFLFQIMSTFIGSRIFIWIFGERRIKKFLGKFHDLFAPLLEPELYKPIIFIGLGILLLAVAFLFGGVLNFIFNILGIAAVVLGAIYLYDYLRDL